jgi:hypothetical protein
MPARNRVTPMGAIEAIALRGAWTGNRGILHPGRAGGTARLITPPASVAALRAGYPVQIDAAALA